MILLLFSPPNIRFSILLSHCANASEFKLVIYTEHFSLIISKQQIQNDKDQLVSSTLNIVKGICTAIDITCEFKLLLWKRAYNLV